MVALIASCSSTKNVTTDNTTPKKEKKLAQQAAIKQAVESRRYIIKMNRIYTNGGGWGELVPRFNFIVVDGEIASVSLPYAGRSYGARRITGVNFNGHTIKYDMVNNEGKGNYKIDMKVAKGGDTFTFYIDISKSGYATVSLLNLMLGATTYNGVVVPVKQTAMGNGR